MLNKLLSVFFFYNTLKLNECFRYDRHHFLNHETLYFFVFLDNNECGSNPCLNDAPCVDGLDNYICACTPGWKGVNCQEGGYQQSVEGGRR